MNRCQIGVHPLAEPYTNQNEETTVIISRSMTHPTGITGPHEHGFDGGAAMVEATPLYSIININDGQSEGGFGGNFSKFQPIGIGKKISLHFSMYIPEEYDFTTNTIALKFVRFHAVTAEGNHDGYVDVMIKNDGFVINSAEISPRKNTVISHPIPRGRWFTVRIDGLINIVGDLKLVVDEQIVADLNDISWVSDGFVDKILFFYLLEWWSAKKTITVFAGRGYRHRRLWC